MNARIAAAAIACACACTPSTETRVAAAAPDASAHAAAAPDARQPPRTQEVAVPTSPSNFVDKLPPAEGEAKDGVHESRGVPSKFEYSGRYGSVTGAVWVRLHKPGSFGPEANLEISVERGTVRGYLAEKPGFRYVQATPGHPASLTGHMVLLHVYRFMLEAVDGEATGVSYRIWR